MRAKPMTFFSQYGEIYPDNLPPKSNPSDPPPPPPPKKSCGYPL